MADFQKLHGGGLTFEDLRILYVISQGTLFSFQGCFIAW